MLCACCRAEDLRVSSATRVPADLLPALRAVPHPGWAGHTAFAKAWHTAFAKPPPSRVFVCHGLQLQATMGLYFGHTGMSCTRVLAVCTCIYTHWAWHSTRTSLYAQPSCMLVRVMPLVDHGGCATNDGPINSQGSTGILILHPCTLCWLPG